MEQQPHPEPETDTAKSTPAEAPHSGGSEDETTTPQTTEDTDPRCDTDPRALQADIDELGGGLEEVAVKALHRTGTKVRRFLGGQ